MSLSSTVMSIAGVLLPIAVLRDFIVADAGRVDRTMPFSCPIVLNIGTVVIAIMLAIMLLLVVVLRLLHRFLRHQRWQLLGFDRLSELCC